MHKHFLLDLHLDYIKEINKLFALYAKEITRDLVCQIKTRTGWILDSYETYIRQKKNRSMESHNDTIKAFVFWYL